jgi:hypothetical protein
LCPEGRHGKAIPSELEHRLAALPVGKLLRRKKSGCTRVCTPNRIRTFPN